MGALFRLSENFKFLSGKTNEVIQQFKLHGVVLKDNRNVVKKISFEETSLVVKSFSGMYFFNRLAYSLFRKSKAQRSFEYAMQLQKLRINTPQPIAYIDIYKIGLLQESYYLSKYDPVTNLYDILNYNINAETFERKSLLNAFAHFVSYLHNNGIFHADLSISNVLVHNEQNSLSFSLVDLNRIKFKKNSYSARIKNLSKLAFLHSQDMLYFLQKFAELNHISYQKISNDLTAYTSKINMIRNFRKKIKAYTLTPIENKFKSIIESLKK
jgi:serine/threonine protein kinase